MGLFGSIPIVGGILDGPEEAKAAGFNGAYAPNQGEYAYGSGMGDTPPPGWDPTGKEPVTVPGPFGTPITIDPYKAQREKAEAELAAWKANEQARALAKENKFQQDQARGDYYRANDLADSARAQGMGLMSNYSGSMNDAQNALNMNYQSRDQANSAFGQSQQARGLQMDAANSYQGVLSGKAPSVAQMQMQQGLADANRGAMQMASSTRGGGGMLLAMKNAQQQQAANSLDVAGKSSMLRAQEQDMARAGLAGVANQMRSGDFGLASGYQQNRAQDLAAGGAYQNQAQGWLGGVNSMQGQQGIDVNRMGLASNREQFYGNQKQHVYDQAQQGSIAYNNAKAGIGTSVMNAQNQVNMANAQNETAHNTALIGGGASVGAALLGGGKK